MNRLEFYEDFFREIEVLQKFKCEFRIFLTQMWCIKLSEMTRWQHCRLPTYRGGGCNQNLSGQLQKTGNLRLTIYMILYIFSPSKTRRANAHRTHPVPTPLTYITYTAMLPKKNRLTSPIVNKYTYLAKPT